MKMNMNKLVLLVLVCISCFAYSQNDYNQDYSLIIDSLYHLDQKIGKTKYSKAKVILKDSTYTREKRKKAKVLVDEWNAINSGNINCLLNLIDKYGFPSKNRVGQKSYNHAMIILVHFDRDTNNKILLPILDKALENKEIEPSYYAWITDRHYALFGGKQNYYSHDPCAFLKLPMADRNRILLNRQEIGLNTFRFSCEGKFYFL